MKLLRADRRFWKPRHSLKERLDREPRALYQALHNPKGAPCSVRRFSWPKAGCWAGRFDAAANAAASRGLSAYKAQAHCGRFSAAAQKERRTKSTKRMASPVAWLIWVACWTGAPFGLALVETTKIEFSRSDLCA